MADLQSGQTLTGESIQSLSAGVSIRGLTKNFGAVEAVAGVNLDIPQGEFFSMLGPSGSGKTTVLRMIAGFETASAGKIYLDGADVTEQAPFDREVNTIFTAPPGVDTIPLWILKEMARPTQASVVNVVATVIIVLSLIPVYVSQRLSRAADDGK